MSSPRYCERVEPHDAHSWVRDPDGYPSDRSPWWGPDHHWCSGVDPSPDLDRLLVQIEDTRGALAAQQRHLDHLLALARDIGRVSNQRRHDLETYGDDEVTCAGCGMSATIDRWLRNDAVHVCPVCGRSGPPV